MKDLLVSLADADAEAFFRSLLDRPAALQIRPIAFDITRHPQHDSGMVQTGAELARMQKGKYTKLLLVWDHHGSGCEHKKPSAVVETEMSTRLDSYTWRGNHTVSVLVPELEQWLWYCEAALFKHTGLEKPEFTDWMAEVCQRSKRSEQDWKQDYPKELFELLMRERLKRTISPRDFEKIGHLASIKQLMTCPTFESILSRLRQWFPAETIPEIIQ